MPSWACTTLHTITSLPALKKQHTRITSTQWKWNFVRASVLLAAPPLSLCTPWKVNIRTMLLLTEVWVGRVRSQWLTQPQNHGFPGAKQSCWLNSRHFKSMQIHTTLPTNFPITDTIKSITILVKANKMSLFKRPSPSSQSVPWSTLTLHSILFHFAVLF